MIVQSVDLHLRLEALDPASSASIWGNIWFEANGYTFPSKHWNDCAEDMLDMWLFHLTDIYSSNNKWYEKDFVFMDGPYEATLRNGNPVTILFKHDGEPVNSFAISLAAFARKVITHKRFIITQRQEALLLSKYSSKASQCDGLENLINQSEEQQKRPV